ncbi:hypothetical protein TanjilG_09069 [Lupinus angustifolius]|uniref:Protein FIP1 n=1 Tax=Lupinus angustifolius TaxID=3871 RepID=A0A394DEW9_LUPAN|nr:hypothetical protein TanjilG_09069 [Lupinus angustifolius]
MATQRFGSPPTSTPEENALFLDILHEAPLFAHRKAARVVGSAGYATLAIGAEWIFRPLQDRISQDLISPVLCSCDVLLLLLTGIFQQYLVYQVHKIRLQGYYSFSQKLKFIVRIPFAITAYGTAAMLLLILWKPYTGFLTISAILRYYDGRLSDQQMALLQYQRENLHFLSEEILRLQESLSKYERTDDRSTPQVDLAHLLAARDQELRTISAEMNQVQSELRLARSLIAERDSEIQLVVTTNNQYVEENERLRAILGEWSTRAAKLERALEAERLSNLELQRKISMLRNHPHALTEATEHGA